MAKNYRVVHKSYPLVDMGPIGQPAVFATISPIDSQQSLGSYLANVKVSVMQNRMYAGPAASAFMVYASTDDSSLSTASVVTAHATPCGGGTVNLSLKRRIRDSDEDPSRSDGPIYLWLECTTNDVSDSEDIGAEVVIEAWGRFIEITDPR